MLFEGSRLGRYQLLRQIGSGGMGTIFLAQDTHLPRQVAVKVVRTDNEMQQTHKTAPHAERLFHREIEAIARLDHPHILPIFDFGSEKINEATYIYLVMPFRPEGSLAEWLRQHQNNDRLPLAETTVLLSQAAEALQHAHEHGIVHQDVKPPNFLVRTRTTPSETLPDLLLTDFGIAQFFSAASDNSHAVRGTPLFMAPEQWDGKPLPASDQYALAVMVFRLLTGQFPFQGGPVQIMHQHCGTQAPTPSALNPQLSLAIDSVILRALAKQASDRFPSVLEFALAFIHAQGLPGDLQSALAIGPLTVRSGEKPEAEQAGASASQAEKPVSASQMNLLTEQIVSTGSAPVPQEAFAAARSPWHSSAAMPNAQSPIAQVPPPFPLPFYSEDTPINAVSTPDRSVEFAPLALGNTSDIDRPFPLKKFPLLSKFLLVSLLILLVLGSGSVFLFKNMAHSLNTSPAQANSTQVAPTTQISGTQVSTTANGVSTVAINQTPAHQGTPVSTRKTAPTSTPTLPGSTPTHAPTPTPHPATGNLPAPPGGSAPASTSFPTTKWWVTTFGTAPGYLGGWKQVGVLYANTNYVFCKAWGAQISDSSGNYNHWWMWTTLDTGGSQGWVSAYYLSKWGNDQAKDNSGNSLPTC